MRFVIITLPPEPILRTIEEFRRPLNEGVGCSQALRYPAHVTLRTGIVCPDDEADFVAREFLAHAGQARRTPIETGELSSRYYRIADEERYLLAWNVVPSRPLMELHRHLLDFRPWAKGPQGDFKPHVTIAFHDLTKEKLERIEFDLAMSESIPGPWFWTIDHVALYFERPEGWIEHSRVNLVR